MKVVIDHVKHVHRGGPVKVGNVYNSRGRPFLKIVVGIAPKDGHRSRWNCVICLHVNMKGDIIGSSNIPESYARDHHDLIGKVKSMPSLKVEWLKEPWEAT